MPGIGWLLRAALALLVLALLAAIAYRDAKTSEIPDAMNLALLALGLAAWAIVPGLRLPSRLIGLVAVSGPMLLLSVARPGSLGGGDVKLMASAGFLLGWQAVLLAAVIGTLIAAAYALWLIAVRKASTSERFPFGPSLCIGIAVAYFFSPLILAWLFT